MKKEELKRKDWLLLMAYSNIEILANTRTILHNQAVIISKLNNTPLQDAQEVIKKNIKVDYDLLVENIRKNIPDYPTKGNKY